MTLASLASSLFWFVPVALQAAIALIMLWRGLIRVFPFFFSYTVLVPTRDIVLLLLPYPGDRYALVFWWGDAMVILLSLGVIAEILWHLFRPYPFLRFVFRWVGVVAVVAAASAVALLGSNNPRGADRVFELIILVERSARLLQLCLLIVLVSLMSRLGLTWQHYSLGIATGFGIYAALDLTLLEFRAHLHSVSNPAFTLLGSAAYNLAVIVWAFYFLKSRAQAPVESLPSHDMANWNDALTQHINKWYRRS